jgi:hypothetical protein
MSLPRLLDGAIMSSTVQTVFNVYPLPQAHAVPVDSTQLIIKQVRERFAQSHRQSLRQIGCEPLDDGFVLWGTVSSYYTKQLAQALAASVVGLARIKNRIVVELNTQSR